MSELSSKTVAEVVRHADLLLESGDEVLCLAPDEWRQIKREIVRLRNVEGEHSLNCRAVETAAGPPSGGYERSSLVSPKETESPADCGTIRKERATEETAMQKIVERTADELTAASRVADAFKQPDLVLDAAASAGGMRSPAGPESVTDTCSCGYCNWLRSKPP